MAASAPRTNNRNHTQRTDRDTDQEPRERRWQATKAGYRTARFARGRMRSGSGPRRALKAEWLLGIVLMWLYPLIAPHTGGFNLWILRQVLWTGVYIGLLILASLHAQLARIAAALGGLALLMLLMAPTRRAHQILGRMELRRLRELIQTPPRDDAVPHTNVPDWLDEVLAPPRPEGGTTGPPESAPPLPLPPAQPVREV